MRSFGEQTCYRLAELERSKKGAALRHSCTPPGHVRYSPSESAERPKTDGEVLQYLLYMHGIDEYLL